MKEWAIDKQDAGQRVDRYLGRKLPTVSESLRQKYIRLKRIRVNGKPAKKDTRLEEADVISVYLNDACFEEAEARPDPLLSTFRPHIEIVYEDENILIVNKRPGLVVHPDALEQVNTLITHVQAYMYQKGEFAPREEGAFVPALVNRIDRFTGGLVIAAKNEAALKELNRRMVAREVMKGYLCVTHGHWKVREGILTHYLTKTPGKKKVYVSDRPGPEAQQAVTRFRVEAEKDGLALVFCELVTGRTHQIRAQFAHVGHALLGDNQYGNPDDERIYGRGYQALWATYLGFAFETDAGVLNGLNGKIFEVEAPFVQEYFPEA
ncbi:MAG: RluA family pseudouridine synthase [Clostridia bacterium]